MVVKAFAVGLAFNGAVGAPAAAQIVRGSEHVSVERVLIDVRVVDRLGRPITDLRAGDLRVSVDGKPAHIESLRWMSAVDAHEGALDATLDAGAPDLPPSSGVPAVTPGRLVVVLVQKDLAASRARGLMAMALRTRTFLDGLDPTDRVAVLSFDYHLKLWLDFTSDRERLRTVIGHDVLGGKPRAIGEATFPSLVRQWDGNRARRAGSIEEALAVTAKALEGLPGSKSIVLFGWGLGRFVPFGRGYAPGAGGVTLAAAYERARDGLLAARATVFALDVTDADFHSLEVGLEALAGDTGGAYFKMHLFPDSAIKHLGRLLAGRYELAIEKPKLPPGMHTIAIELIGRKGSVLAKRAYVD